MFPASIQINIGTTISHRNTQNDFGSYFLALVQIFTLWSVILTNHFNSLFMSHSWASVPFQNKMGEVSGKHVSSRPFLTHSEKIGEFKPAKYLVFIFCIIHTST